MIERLINHHVHLRREFVVVKTEVKLMKLNEKIKVRTKYYIYIIFDLINLIHTIIIGSSCQKRQSALFTIFCNYEWLSQRAKEND